MYDDLREQCAYLPDTKDQLLIVMNGRPKSDAIAAFTRRENDTVDVVGILSVLATDQSEHLKRALSINCKENDDVLTEASQQTSRLR